MPRPRRGEPGHEEAINKMKQTMIARYGVEGYHKKMQEIGRKGGKVCGKKGFALNIDNARKAGASGGAKSMRGYKLVKDTDDERWYEKRETGEKVKYVYDAEKGKFIKDDMKTIVEAIQNENWI